MVKITTEGIFIPMNYLKSDWDYIGGHDLFLTHNQKKRIVISLIDFI